MGQSKISSDGEMIDEGMLKQKLEDKFRRDVNNVKV